MSHQVRVFFEFGIPMSRQHLTMGIDVDAPALRLFQQFLEVQQIMPGYQDALALDVPQVHRSWFGMTEGFGVSMIQQFHNPQVDGTAFLDQVKPVFHIERGIGEVGQCSVHELIYLRILLSQQRGVMNIGGHSSQPVDQNLLQGHDIRISLRKPQLSDFFSLPDHTLQVAGGHEVKRRIVPFITGYGISPFADQVLPQLNRFSDILGQRLGVKIDIGKGSKQRFSYEAVNFRLIYPRLPQCQNHSAQTTDSISQ